MPGSASDAQVCVNEAPEKCHPNFVDAFSDVAGTEVIHRDDTFIWIFRIGECEVVFNFVAAQPVFASAVRFLLITVHAE